MARLVVSGADWEDTPQIDNGLDYTVTGYILDTRYGSPITTGLGTLASTVSLNETTATAGPTPTDSGLGAFSITIPYATMLAATNGLSLLLATITSSVAHARPWKIFLRPWFVAEQNAIETDKFIGALSDTVQEPSIQDFYTGLWYPANLMATVDGRPVHVGLGYKSKNLESELI